MREISTGQLLIQKGIITSTQLDLALIKLNENTENLKNYNLDDILIKLGFITEAELLNILSEHLRVPFIDLSSVKTDINIVLKIPEFIAKKNICFAYRIDNGRLFVASTDPLNLFKTEELKITTGMEIYPVLAAKSAILEAIRRTYSQSNATIVADDLNKEYSADNSTQEQENEERIGSAPVVKFINSLVEAAYRSNASDIHIEPFREQTIIRIRVDGDLIEHMKVNPGVHASLVTRLKILGGMNIAEKRVPLDGRFGMTIENKNVDLRVSSIPTVYGEKVVLRLLAGSSEKSRHITELGMTGYNYEMFKRIIRCPHGIMLVTGPTGSGKTTTLYAALAELYRPHVNIVTVEDPVEKKIDRINQVQINVKAGLTFAAALRSILRQDPDIIMVGEIRDNETADIAVRAAITGHLVLSTLHTNNAAGTILRLINMGVAPYMVASSIIGVIAQRLVKLLCEKCKEPYILNDSVGLSFLNAEKPVTIYKNHIGGCAECGGTGFKGRTAIHEIIVSSNDIKEIIAHNGTTTEIEIKAVQNGTKLLQKNAAELVLAGKTTLNELIRATYSL